MSPAVIAALLLWAPAATAQAPSPAQEVIEEAESVEAVEEVAVEGGSRVGELVGYFHSAAVHMPIAWLVLLALVDVATFALRKGELLRLGFALLAITAASFVPAMLTGLARLENMALEPEALAPAVQHRNIMFICAAIVLAALALRWRKKNQLGGAPAYAYGALLTAATALVIIGGHLGGAMIFGDPPF